MSNDVFFYRAGESFIHIQNEFTDFLPEVILHRKFPKLRGGLRQRCAVVYYVRRRGKPPTWLPRQKLAEERIPSATTNIENVQSEQL